MPPESRSKPPPATPKRLLTDAPLNSPPRPGDDKVTAVARALSILTAFGGDELFLPLA